MLFFILMPLLIIVGLPLIVAVMSLCVASSVRGLAERQGGAPDFPTGQWLERTYQPEAEPEGVWPPPPGEGDVL